MKDRASLAKELVEMRRPYRELLQELEQYGWDCEDPRVALTSGHLETVLSKYIVGDIDASDVDGWAEAIEGRDDIEYCPDSVVGVTLHELANPVLTQQLDSVRARELLARLGGNAT